MLHSQIGLSKINGIFLSWKGQKKSIAITIKLLLKKNKDKAKDEDEGEDEYQNKLKTNVVESIFGLGIIWK